MDKRCIFLSLSVLLALGGCVQEAPPPAQGGETAWEQAQAWVELDAVPEGGTDLELDEFPGAVFTCTRTGLTVTREGTESKLFSFLSGDIYLWDLTGDGLPELCAQTSVGSGTVHDSILIYDLAAGHVYSLSDRGEYDYALSLEGGTLMGTRTAYPRGSDDPEALTGPLTLEGRKKARLAIASET